MKADIHSSDDTASTSSASSHDHHYEDITPTHLEGRDRETSRRSRHKKDIPDEDEEVTRQRQRLQGLDDLIAG